MGKRGRITRADHCVGMMEARVLMASLRWTFPRKAKSACPDCGAKGQLESKDGTDDKGMLIAVAYRCVACKTFRFYRRPEDKVH